MKNCSDIREAISMYIDKQMTADEIKEFEQHIAACADCGHELEETIKAIEMCKNIEEEELPANFKNELRQKLEQSKDETKSQAKILMFRSKYFKIFSSVAAIFVLIFLMQVLYNSSIKVNVNPNNTTERMMAKDAAISTMSAVAVVENRKTTINLTAEQSDSRVFEIPAMAEKLGGKEEPNAASKLLSSMPSTLVFIIPNDKYEEFSTLLTKKFGAINVSPKPLASEDMTNLLDQYIDQSEKLNLKILDMEKTSSSDANEIEKLRQEKAALDEQIKSINYYKDYTQVTIEISYARR